MHRGWVRGKKRGNPSEGGQRQRVRNRTKRMKDDRGWGDHWMRCVFWNDRSSDGGEESATSHLPSDKPSFVSPSTPGIKLHLHTPPSLPLLLSGAPFPSLSRCFITSSPPLCHFLSLLHSSFLSLANFTLLSALNSPSHAFHLFASLPLSFHLLKNDRQSVGENEGCRGQVKYWSGNGHWTIAHQASSLWDNGADRWLGYSSSLSPSLPLLCKLAWTYVCVCARALKQDKNAWRVFPMNTTEAIKVQFVSEPRQPFTQRCYFMSVHINFY